MFEPTNYTCDSNLTNKEKKSGVKDCVANPFWERAKLFGFRGTAYSCDCTQNGKPYKQRIFIRDG